MMMMKKKKKKKKGFYFGQYLHVSERKVNYDLTSTWDHFGSTIWPIIIRNCYLYSGPTPIHNNFYWLPEEGKKYLRKFRNWYSFDKTP
jgi:hypothetical protein